VTLGRGFAELRCLASRVVVAGRLWTWTFTAHKRMALATHESDANTVFCAYSTIASPVSNHRCPVRNETSGSPYIRIMSSWESPGQPKRYFNYGQTQNLACFKLASEGANRRTPTAGNEARTNAPPRRDRRSVPTPPRTARSVWSAWSLLPLSTALDTARRQRITSVEVARNDGILTKPHPV
jgi:hypothetical protein